MNTSETHRHWYNDFYKDEQRDFTSWYAVMLPELVDCLKNKMDSTILEVGCGQAKGLRYLVDKQICRAEQLYGIDQSDEAVRFSKRVLPRADFRLADIYHLPFEAHTFDVVLMMEVIEHMEDPLQALKAIHRVLKPNGTFILSFPNYFHAPWLAVRLLSQWLKKPNWIVLQPIDKIYTTLHIMRLCQMAGFQYQRCLGSTYFPPLVWKYERPTFTKWMNRLKLGHLSFHPVLFLRSV